MRAHFIRMLGRTDQQGHGSVCGVFGWAEVKDRTRRACSRIAPIHAHDKSRFATQSWCMLAQPTRLVNPSHAPRACTTIALEDSLIVGVEEMHDFGAIGGCSTSTRPSSRSGRQRCWSVRVQRGPLQGPMVWCGFPGVCAARRGFTPGYWREARRAARRGRTIGLCGRG